MRRRAFLAGMAAVVAASRAGEAQQAGKVPKIGILTVAPQPWPYLPTFEAALRDHGHVPGQSVLLEILSADQQPGRLPTLAADLIHHHKVDLVVIPACGSHYIGAVRQASKTIPLVVALCGDLPGFIGEVASFARPGGHTTGLTFFAPELSAKRLELMKETSPGLARVAVLWNPADGGWDPYWRQLRVTGDALRLKLQSVELRTQGEVEGALARVVRERADAILTLSDPIIVWQSRHQLIEFALRQRLLIAGDARDFAEHGALISYGPNFTDMIRSVASYADKLLKGATPADMPIERPTKFELIINLKTAKALGLTIPPSLLLRADQVIE